MPTWVAGKAFLIGGDDETFSIITDEREALQSSPDTYKSIPHHVGRNSVVVRLARISPKRLIKANPESDRSEWSEAPASAHSV